MFLGRWDWADDQMKNSHYFQSLYPQRYVAWNLHEGKEGVYNFIGDNDLEGFINMAQSAGLLVIVRAGELYTCTLYNV